MDGLHVAQPRRMPWLGLMIGGLTVFGPLSIDMYLPALPQLSHDLHAGAALTELTITGFLIGLGLGQLLIGSISDSIGRRRPVIVGLAGFVVVTVLCAIAPSIYVLLPLRILQGLFGATGVVLARAIARDLYSGAIAARFFSRLMLVTGLAPILAPIIGAQILRVASWRAIFMALALIGAAILAVQYKALPETLEPGSRRSGGLTDTRRSVRQLLDDRLFVRLILTQACANAGALAYIAGSSFVLQNVYGLSPQQFGLVFGLNALAMVGCAQLNAALIARHSAWKLLGVGRALAFIGAASVLAVVLVGGLGVWAILPGLLLTIASNGFIMPNTTVLALENYPAAAGTAAALLGISGYLAGAIAAPLPGVAGEFTALPLAIVIASTQVTGALLLFGRRRTALQDPHPLVPVEAIVPIDLI